jgi:hypothetical protein
MKDYKTLTDESLWGIIDSDNTQEIKAIKELSKTDPEFKLRLKTLQQQNKEEKTVADAQLIELLEKQLPKVSDEKRPGIQECIDIFKGIINQTK